MLQPLSSGDGAAAAPRDPAFLRAFFRLPASATDAEVLAYADALGQADAAKSALDDAEGRLDFLQSALGVPPAAPPPPPRPASVVARQMPPTPFPVDALPAPVAALVRAGAAAVDCDEAYVAVPALSALAGALGNALWAEVKRSWREPPVVWTATVAQSGGGKSPGMGHALAPIYRAERALGDAYKAARREHDEAARAYDALSKAERAALPPPSPPVHERLRTGDPTIEGLVARLQDNPRGLLLVRDELAGLLAGHDKYRSGGGDEQAWIELWGARQLVVDRKGDGATRVERPAVSVAGGIQPDTLREKLGGRSTLTHSGYLARLLLALPPDAPVRYSDADVHPHIYDPYADLLRTLRAVPYHEGETGPDGEQSGGPRYVPFSAEGRAVLRRFIDENAGLYGHLRGPLRAALAKLAAYAVRFALLLHAADEAAAGRLGPHRSDPGPIPASAAYRAVRIAAYFRREAVRAYGRLGLLGKGEEGGPLGTGAPHDRDERLALRLPSRFGADDVERVAGLSRSGAYKALNRLLKKGLCTDDGRGWYRRTTLSPSTSTTGWTVDNRDQGDAGDQPADFAAFVARLEAAFPGDPTAHPPPVSEPAVIGPGTPLVVKRGPLAGRRGVATSRPVGEGGAQYLSADVEGVPCRLAVSDVEKDVA